MKVLIEKDELIVSVEECTDETPCFDALLLCVKTLRAVGYSDSMIDRAMAEFLGGDYKDVEVEIEEEGSLEEVVRSIAGYMAAEEGD